MIQNYVLIIGSMKSGTTTLFDLLAAHPAIASSKQKEPGFFALSEVWDKGWNWFEALFDFHPSQHAYVMEASTDYSKQPFTDDVVSRLKSRHDVNFKLIYLMRHPLRRIESHAKHVQRARMEVGRRISDVPDHTLDAGVSPVSIAISHYAEQIAYYQEWFDCGDLLLITLEELTADQSGVLKRIMNFLDLPEISVERSQASNRAEDRREALPIVNKFRSAPLLSGLVRKIVPRKVRRTLKSHLTKPVVVEGRFKLTEAEEADILARLAPDLDRLRRDYGVDTARWWGLD